MSKTPLETLNASLKNKSEELVNLLDKMDGEQGATPAQLTAWQEQVSGLEGEMKSLRGQIDSAEQREALRGQALANIQRVGTPANGMQHDGAPAGGSTKSMADLFVGSAEYKSWLQQVAPNGTIMSGGQGMRLPNSQAVALQAGYKTLLTGGTSFTAPTHTSSNALVQIDQRGLLDTGVWQRPLRIADLISKGETGSDTISYARITGVTNNAAPTAEATATGGSSGSKPESAMAFEVVHDRVKTIPHWIPATRQALMDAAQIRTLIENFLRYGLAEELEDQIIAGSGSGENFQGVLNVSGLLTQAYSTDLLTTARKSLTNLILNGRVTPSAFVMHPSDWEAYDLLKDGQGRYYFGGPQSLGTPRLWGVPVVQSEAVSVGTALVADWSYAQLWDRMQATIMVSDSHSDFFTRNLIAILAEMRAGFGVIRPKAFCSVDLTA